MVTQNDLISIVIPVYKVEPYLDKCVGSILAQTYGNIEVILVDDGSPDRCGEMCDGYAALDSRVRVVHKPNGGLSSARNAGIDIANGKYIGFIDSDDWIEPVMYETLHEAIVKYGADIAVCSRHITYLNGKDVNWATKKKDRVMTREEALAHVFALSDFDMSAVDKLYRRGLFDTVRYPVGKINEDYYACLNIFYICDKVVYIPQSLYHYIKHPGGICSNLGISQVDASNHMIRFFEEKCPSLVYAGRSARFYAYLEVLNHSIVDRIPIEPELMAEARRALSEDLPCMLRNKVIPLKWKLISLLARYNFRLYKWLKEKKNGI